VGRSTPQDVDVLPVGLLEVVGQRGGGVGKRQTRALSAMVAWLAIVRTRQAVDRFGRRSMDHLGLGLSDFAILESVLHVGPLTPSQLGERVGLTRGSITSAVDRLAVRGLVTREPNAADARSSLVRLTQAGTEVIETAWKVRRLLRKEYRRSRTG
jgi:MarR family 2-MHQ and catechol resistance regulon transcriptional repressor